MNKNLQFYLRRLHGISGIMPIGFFLLYHLKDGASFSEHGVIFAAVFLWVPLLFHAVYGGYITWEGSINTRNYDYLRNFMYLLQRITGALVFIFIGIHMYLMKSGNMGSSPFFNYFLLAGVILSIFHFANGFFGFLIDMGIIVGEKAQKFAVGLSFAAFFLFAVYGIQKYLNFVG